MSTDRSALELLVDVTVVVPVTVGASLVEQLPRIVKRTRQEITVARFIGKMVVDSSARQLRHRISAPHIEVSTESSGADTPAQREAATPATGPPADVESPSSVGLVLPDYDHLPASHVVAKLASLDQAERNSIELYERSHRARRTVLGKLEQLRVG